MQTVELKDQHNNVIMTVSSKNPGTFKTPTVNDAKNYFLNKLHENEHLWIYEPIDHALINKLKAICGQWFNFSVESFEFDNNELTGLTIYQSGTLGTTL